MKKTYTKPTIIEQGNVTKITKGDYTWPCKYLNGHHSCGGGENAS